MWRNRSEIFLEKISPIGLIIVTSVVVFMNVEKKKKKEFVKIIFIIHFSVLAVPCVR